MERKSASKNGAALDASGDAKRTEIYRKATNAKFSSSFVPSSRKGEDGFQNEYGVQGAAGGHSSSDVQRPPPTIGKRNDSKRANSLQTTWSSKPRNGRLKLEKNLCAPETQKATNVLQSSCDRDGAQKSAESVCPNAEVKLRKLDPLPSVRGGLSSSSILEKPLEDLISLCKGDLFRYLWLSYRQTQPPLILLLDSFIVSLVLMAALLSSYVLLVGTAFPRNAFVAALLSCGGTALLTVSLRTQGSEEKEVFTSHPTQLHALVDDHCTWIHALFFGDAVDLSRTYRSWVFLVNQCSAGLPRIVVLAHRVQKGPIGIGSCLSGVAAAIIYPGADPFSRRLSTVTVIVACMPGSITSMYVHCRVHTAFDYMFTAFDMYREIYGDELEESRCALSIV